MSQQLDYHRATLLLKLDGLTDEQLRQPLTKSGLTLIGLVKHAERNERGWFVEIAAGVSHAEQHADEVPDADFRVPPAQNVDDLVNRYVATCEQSRQVVAAAQLDDIVTTPWGAEVNLRAIMLHMIQETARHNGHADIIREELDGTTGQ